MSFRILIALLTLIGIITSFTIFLSFPSGSHQMIYRSGLSSILTKIIASGSAFAKKFRSLSYTSATSKMSSESNGDIPVVNAPNLKLLNQNEAIQVDLDLFNEYKFAVDQLMELAGLSVATAVAKLYSSEKSKKVLIITGPGNNGGDGLVAARHLKLFGFEDVVILNARKPTKDLYINLLHQAEQTDVNISYDAASFTNDSTIGLMVDALFGFSFKPPVRPDFQPLMDLLVSYSGKSVPVVSVDIPSGWDVEKGPPEDQSIRFMPDTLVSLTAPKLCASHFQGRYHFLGGRFIPKSLEKKYDLNLPEYPATECVVRLK